MVRLADFYCDQYVGYNIPRRLVSVGLVFIDMAPFQDREDMWRDKVRVVWV